MKEVTVYIVELRGETMLETLDHDEQLRVANRLYRRELAEHGRRGGATPELYEYERTPLDHTATQRKAA